MYTMAAIAAKVIGSLFLMSSNFFSPKMMMHIK